MNPTITRLDHDLSTIEEATFVGGSGVDQPSGVSLALDGSVILTSTVRSADHPVSADAFQSATTGPPDIVVSMMSPDLSQLVFGTYFGGPEADSASEPTGSGSWGC